MDITLVALFLVSLATTVVVMAPLRRRLIARGNLDTPNHRSSHSVAVPRGAGLACAAGVLSGWIMAVLLAGPAPTGALAAGLTLGTVGLADDKWTLGSTPRLAAQVLVGATFGLTYNWWWAVASALLFVVVVNSVNFMDGINGITGLSVLVWSTTTVWIGVTYGLVGCLILGLLTGGAALGFLPWNVPKGRIFLGDVGSYLFGGLISAGAVYAVAGGAPVGVVLAPIAVYIFDVLRTLGIRKRRGQPLTEAHRDHIYQVASRQLNGRHTLVASLVAGLSALFVFLHATLDPLMASSATAVGLALYSALPLALSRHRRVLRT